MRASNSTLEKIVQHRDITTSSTKRFKDLAHVEKIVSKSDDGITNAVNFLQKKSTRSLLPVLVMHILPTLIKNPHLFETNNNVKALVNYCVQQFPALRPWNIARICESTNDIRHQYFYVRYLCTLLQSDQHGATLRRKHDFVKIWLSQSICYLSDKRCVIGQKLCLQPVTQTKVPQSTAQLQLPEKLMRFSRSKAFFQRVFINNQYNNNAVGGDRVPLKQIQMIAYMVLCCIQMQPLNKYVREICHRYNYLPGLLLSCQQLDTVKARKRHSLELLVRHEYKSFGLFRDYVFSVEMNGNDWQLVVQTFVNCQNNNNNQQNHIIDKMSENGIVTLMIASIGALNTIELLSTQKSPWIEFSKGISRQLFYHIIKASQIEQEKETVVYQCLELTNNRLWEQNLTSKAVQFRQLDDVLTGTSSTKQLKQCALFLWEDEKKTAATSSQQNGMKFGFDLNAPLPKFLGEMTNHWGVQTNIYQQACQICTQPLVLPTECQVDQWNLVVFPCGHVFHDFCLPEAACRLCCESNFKSLF